MLQCLAQARHEGRGGDVGEGGAGGAGEGAEGGEEGSVDKSEDQPFFFELIA